MHREVCDFYLDDKLFPWGGQGYVHVVEDYKNVYVTFEHAFKAGSWVKVSLETAGTSGERWSVIGTKKGQAWNDFMSKQNYNAVFNNIAMNGQYLRVRVALYSVWNGSIEMMGETTVSHWVRQ